MNQILIQAAAGEHDNLPFWQEVWSIFGDPAHIVAELGWTIIQDVILVWLLYGTLWKKVILPRLHEKFDKEHAITHHDHDAEHESHHRPGAGL